MERIFFEQKKESKNLRILYLDNMALDNSQETESLNPNNLNTNSSDSKRSRSESENKENQENTSCCAPPTRTSQILCCCVKYISVYLLGGLSSLIIGFLLMTRGSSSSPSVSSLSSISKIDSQNIETCQMPIYKKLYYDVLNMADKFQKMDDSWELALNLTLDVKDSSLKENAIQYITYSKRKSSNNVMFSGFAIFPNIEPKYLIDTICNLNLQKIWIKNSYDTKDTFKVLSDGQAVNLNSGQIYPGNRLNPMVRYQTFKLPLLGWRDGVFLHSKDLVKFRGKTYFVSCKRHENLAKSFKMVPKNDDYTRTLEKVVCSAMTSYVDPKTGSTAGTLYSYFISEEQSMWFPGFTVNRIVKGSAEVAEQQYLVAEKLKNGDFDDKNYSSQVDIFDDQLKLQYLKVDDSWDDDSEERLYEKCLQGQANATNIESETDEQEAEIESYEDYVYDYSD